MIYDPTFLWSRVASIAFAEQLHLRYAVYVAILRPGQHEPADESYRWIEEWHAWAPQTPPFGAKSTLEGWLINGTTLTNSTDSSPVSIKSYTSSASPSSTAKGTAAGSATGSAASSSSSSTGAAVLLVRPAGLPDLDQRCAQSQLALVLRNAYLLRMF